MIDFTVDSVPIDVIVAQQQMIEQVYQQQNQMQMMQPANPNANPVSQQAAGGE